jgi:hypothetical protein
MNCLICAEHVRPGKGLRTFTAWELDGEIAGKEVTGVVHSGCYMRLPPEERDAILAHASEEAQS